MTAAAMRPQYVMQVMLQLPGGQTVPVQIPAAIGQGPSPGPNPGPSTLASPPTSLPAGPATVHVLSHQVMPHLQVGAGFVFQDLSSMISMWVSQISYDLGYI